MEKNVAIKVTHVSKDFKLYYDKANTLKERIVRFSNNKKEVRHILKNINLEIKKGEFVFIIGASGSGKSTLIKLLYRQEKPSRGEVYVGGVNVSKLRNGKVYKLRRKLGIVFQDYKLLPKLTVYENGSVHEYSPMIICPFIILRVDPLDQPSP